METASGHRGTCAESTNARAIVGPITLENVVRVVTVTCLKRVLGVSRNAFAEAQGICRPVVPSRKLSGAPLRPGRFTHPSSWVGSDACPKLLVFRKIGRPSFAWSRGRKRSWTGGSFRASENFELVVGSYPTAGPVRVHATCAHDRHPAKARSPRWSGGTFLSSGSPGVSGDTIVQWTHVPGCGLIGMPCRHGSEWDGR